MFWSIESFHINTTWKVGFLACVLPGSVPIRRSLLSKWTHLHTRQCSMCSMAKQLCEHAKSRKSMLFMQTLLTKQCLSADVTQKPARFITFSIVKSLSSPMPERGSVVLIVFLRFGLSSKLSPYTAETWAAWTHFPGKMDLKMLHISQSKHLRNIRWRKAARTRWRCNWSTDRTTFSDL